jgi:soluble P-type ATPase
MLKKSTLGFAVVQGEGTAFEAMLGADVVLPDISAALDLLINPLRLIATLRS